MSNFTIKICNAANSEYYVFIHSWLHVCRYAEAEEVGLGLRVAILYHLVFMWVSVIVVQNQQTIWGSLWFSGYTHIVQALHKLYVVLKEPIDRQRKEYFL